MLEFFGIAFNKTDFLIPALQIRLRGYNADTDFYLLWVLFS
jgi:hypothetical protein